MKKSLMDSYAHVALKAVMAMSFLVLSSACSGSEESKGRQADMPPKAELPYGIVFNKKGGFEIVGLGPDANAVKVVPVKDSEFPIKGKIRRVETITLVTYEASCDVLVKGISGYKKIVIHNDAICASIFP